MQVKFPETQGPQVSPASEAVYKDSEILEVVEQEASQEVEAAPRDQEFLPVAPEACRDSVVYQD